METYVARNRKSLDVGRTKHDHTDDNCGDENASTNESADAQLDILLACPFKGSNTAEDIRGAVAKREKGCTGNVER